MFAENLGVPGRSQPVSYTHLDVYKRQPKGFIVVIGFDSVEKAREWYDSPAYAAIKPFRQSSTKSRIFIAEGVAPQ